MIAEIGKTNINIYKGFTKGFKTKSDLEGLRVLAKDRIKWRELTAIICEQAQDNQ